MVASQSLRVSARRVTVSSPAPPQQDLAKPVAEFGAQPPVRRSRGLTVSQTLNANYEQSEAYSLPAAVRRRAATVNARENEPVAVDLNGTGHHLDDANVDILDVVDPQVSTASYFSNVSNSIALPTLPWFENRKPVVELQRMDTATTDTTDTHVPDDAMTSQDHLDLHLEKVTKASRTRKETLKRAWRGFIDFAKTPVGVFFVIYGILVVFWGAALVLILIHAIPMPSSYRRDVWVEICSQILNGLFTVTGVGLIPFRLRDTWNMGIILRSRDLTKDRRKAKGLIPLKDINELPTHHQPATAKADLEKRMTAEEEYVLTEKEEMRLERAQAAFAKSQTWYRAHETATHRAFPVGIALIICLLIDGNSAFQVCLCIAMWGWNWHDRPAWTTGTCIPLSFGCGIAGALMITIYGKRAKKTTEVEKAIADAKHAKKAARHDNSFLGRLHHGHSQTGTQSVVPTGVLPEESKAAVVPDR